MTKTRIGAAILVIGLIVFGASFALSDHAKAGGLATEDLSGALTPQDLANDLVGGGITISNVTYTGADVAAGRFTGGTGIIGFDTGIILSTGIIANVVGPNELDNVTTDNSTAGDAKLDALSGQTTYDASVLEFDFVPSSSPILFNYVFASDEYNEFVNTEFNDVFAFNVNGTNCALVGGDPVSINTINNGRPYGTSDTGPPAHPELYRNNDLDDGGGSIDTEMDGLTTVLTCTSPVNVGVTNHMKLAIADASDSAWDANVFLEAQSFVAQPTDTPTPTITPTPGPMTETPTAGPATETPTPGPATDTPLPPTATRTSTPVPPKACGDVNDDGLVNSLDAALILQLHAGLRSTLPNSPSADVNSDGTRNSIDSALVLQKEAGFIAQSALHCP